MEMEMDMEARYTKIPLPTDIKTIVITYLCEEEDIVSLLNVKNLHFLWKQCLKCRLSPCSSSYPFSVSDRFVKTLMRTANCTDVAESLLTLLNPQREQYVHVFLSMCQGADIDMALFWWNKLDRTPELAYLGLDHFPWCWYFSFSDIDTAERLLAPSLKEFGPVISMEQRVTLFCRLCSSGLIRSAEYLDECAPIDDIQDYND